MFVPMVITYRSLSARIIHAPSDGLYHATWALGGIRGKVASRSLENVKAKAIRKLKLLHQGWFSIATLSDRDANRISSAISMLAEYGHNDLLQVASEYVAIMKASPGFDPLEAVKYYARSHVKIEPIPFKAATESWLAHKRKRWSQSNRENIEKRIPRIINAFQVDVCEIDHEVVSCFLDTFERHSPKTRNHFREILKGILGYARNRQWIDEGTFDRTRDLLKNEPAPSASPEILAVQQFRDLLAAADGSELLPMIALGGFTGARQSEIKRLSWEDVWRRKSHVELESEKTKTRRRRLVPRCEALVAWLAPYTSKTGLIWPHTDKAFDSRYYRLRGPLGIRGNNLLRHSYASYRLALVSENEVAKEMGNSPEMIYSNYREIVEAEEAKEWFNSHPPPWRNEDYENKQSRPGKRDNGYRGKDEGG